MSTKVEKCKSCHTETSETIRCDGCGKVMRRSPFYGGHRHPRRRLRRRRAVGFRASVEISGRRLGEFREFDACSAKCFALALYKATSGKSRRVQITIAGTPRQVLGAFMIKRLAAIAVVLVVLGGACSLVPPPQGPSYGALAAGGQDCTGYDLASMAWTGVASAAAGLATAGAAVLPAVQDYPDAVLGVSITDAVLGALAVTAALLANETASRYTRCVEGAP